jgi:hypothetical protein
VFSDRLTGGLFVAALALCSLARFLNVLVTYQPWPVVSTIADFSTAVVSTIAALTIPRFAKRAACRIDALEARVREQEDELVSTAPVEARPFVSRILDLRRRVNDVASL